MSNSPIMGGIPSSMVTPTENIQLHTISDTQEIDNILNQLDDNTKILLQDTNSLHTPSQLRESRLQDMELIISDDMNIVNGTILKGYIEVKLISRSSHSLGVGTTISSEVENLLKTNPDHPVEIDLGEKTTNLQLSQAVVQANGSISELSGKIIAKRNIS